jgi:predicted 3-demethylubiquinone-9 3-methyltransferase (glyoxalase superfamily)
MTDMAKQPAKNTICLWYDKDAEEAARFYAKTFPDSSVGEIMRAPGDNPSGKQGDVLVINFTVLGIPCMGLNGGPQFKHSEAFSFQVATETQAETDRYWERHRQQRRPGKRLRLVQGQMGRVLADHAGDADESGHRSRSCRRQARLRRDDDHAQDRHCRDRGGAARVSTISSHAGAITHAM